MRIHNSCRLIHEATGRTPQASEVLGSLAGNVFTESGVMLIDLDLKFCYIIDEVWAKIIWGFGVGGMISTVTTSTVSTVTTVALAASLALLAVVALLMLLIQKEIASASDDSRLRTYGKILNIAVVPLLFGFIFIAVVKVAEVLR